MFVDAKRLDNSHATLLAQVQGICAKIRESKTSESDPLTLLRALNDYLPFDARVDLRESGCMVEVLTHILELLPVSSNFITTFAEIGCCSSCHQENQQAISALFPLSWSTTTMFCTQASANSTVSNLQVCDPYFGNKWFLKVPPGSDSHMAVDLSQLLSSRMLTQACALKTGDARHIKW